VTPLFLALTSQQKRHVKLATMPRALALISVAYSSGLFPASLQNTIIAEDRGQLAKVETSHLVMLLQFNCRYVPPLVEV